jgi:hypothetical protein
VTPANPLHRTDEALGRIRDAHGEAAAGWAAEQYGDKPGTLAYLAGHPEAFGAGWQLEQLRRHVDEVALAWQRDVYAAALDAQDPFDRHVPRLRAHRHLTSREDLERVEAALAEDAAQCPCGSGVTARACVRAAFEEGGF